MIKLCVVGAAGRLGSCVLQALCQPEFSTKIKLIGAIVSSQFIYKNNDKNKVDGLVFSDKLNDYIDQVDIILDCSLPESSIKTLALAKSAHKKLILCATGFNMNQLDHIKQAAQILPLVFAPNTSIGMNLTHALVKWLAAKMPEKTDIQILETHHRHKKDAPSGAAQQLANTVFEITHTQPEVTSMRVGETIGEHTLLFTVGGEQIQLTHKAFDRSIFALGALRAALWVNQVTQPGFYTMADVLGLE